jgi:poly-gamma-glutamate synthase PgsB/CapB
MAITPEYITTIEEQIVKSTIGVITNVREDHLDVMGPSVRDVALNLTRSLPKNGIAFTAERKWFDLMAREATKKGTQLIQANAEDITDQEMEGFPYIEHKENVAIALAVARHLGVPREKALQRMYVHQPDPGVLVELMVKRLNGTMYFYNALAANDPDSSLIIWNMALSRRKFPGTILLIIRADREQRTEGFARILGMTMTAQRYVIAGSPVEYVRGQLRKNGVADDAIITLEKPDAKDVVKAIYNFSGDQVMVAMGNIVGLGDAVVSILEKDSREILNQIDSDIQELEVTLS